MQPLLIILLLLSVLTNVLLILLLQRSGQIDRRGRFPHAALLIDKRQNLRHTHFTPLRPHFAFYYNVLILKMQEVM